MLKKTQGDNECVIISADRPVEYGTLDGNTIRVRADDEPEIIYVNAYSVCRCYGGPEEGGWYYDEGQPLASVPLRADVEAGVIEIEKSRLTSLLGWTSKYSRSSVLGGDDFKVYVEDHTAVPFPEVRPHYE